MTINILVSILLDFQPPRQIYFNKYLIYMYIYMYICIHIYMYIYISVIYFPLKIFFHGSKYRMHIS